MELLSTLYNHFIENTVEGGGLLFFTFVFGNFLMCLISGLLCLVTKNISIYIYDLFGFILGSSLIAMVANLILIPFVLFQVTAKPIFYLGCIITMTSYFIIAYNFFWLNSLGKKMKQHS